MGFKSIALVASTLVLSTNAMAVTINIDFEEIDNSAANVFSGNSLDTQGFNLTNDNSSSDAILHWSSTNIRNADAGGVTFSHNYAGSTTTLTQLNGEAFDLFTIDFADINNSGTIQNITIDAVTVTGTLFSNTITLDMLSGLETFDFNWYNLASASWTETTGAFLQLDNIAVATTVVPVPAAVWLFGSGLIGLTGIARRKKS